MTIVLKTASNKPGNSVRHKTYVSSQEFVGESGAITWLHDGIRSFLKFRKDLILGEKLPCESKGYFLSDESQIYWTIKNFFCIVIVRFFDYYEEETEEEDNEHTSYPYSDQSLAW